MAAGETEGEIGFDIDWDVLPASTQAWVLPLVPAVSSDGITAEDVAYVMVPGISRDPLTGQIRMYLSSEGAHVDVFYTEGNDKCIIYYPGGGFSNLTQNNDIVPDCLDHGVSIGMVTYRLPAGDRFRTIQDCEEALYAMASAGERFGGYVEAGVMGESAGGHSRASRKRLNPKAKRLCGHPLVAYLGVRLALSSAVDFLCSGGQIC